MKYLIWLISLAIGLIGIIIYQILYFMWYLEFNKDLQFTYKNCKEFFKEDGMFLWIALITIVTAAIIWRFYEYF
jgi:magnesium-transporting ATPase (P-type)